MTTVIPNEGLDWYRDRSLNINNAGSEKVYSVGLGNGSSSVSSSDTQLNSEVYRADDDDSNVTISASTETGDYTAEITVTGGTEVPSGTDVTELGVWARDPTISDSNVTESDDKMLYHEGFSSSVTVSSGETETFTIEINIVDA